MKIEKTFTATIYLGLKERNSGIVHTLEEVENSCQSYCDAIGLCVTVTPTTFIYKDGREPGCAIGLINYPRFPSKPNHIVGIAQVLGTVLMSQFKQYRVSVVCPDKTYMLENNIEDKDAKG